MYHVGDKVEFCTFDCVKFIPKRHEGTITDVYSETDSLRIRDKNGLMFFVSRDLVHPMKKQESKKMKKSDLKNKMFVKTRNGELYIVVDDIFVGENGGYMMLSSFDEDLFYDTFGNHADNYDIMVVYEQANSFKSFKNELWVREETKEMHFSNDLDFISDIADCLYDYKKRGAEKVTITFKMK